MGRVESLSGGKPVLKLRLNLKLEDLICLKHIYGHIQELSLDNSNYSQLSVLVVHPRQQYF